MGVHAVRPGDLDKSFTHVLIFGYYGGKMTFVEPMATRDFLLTKQTIAYDMPMPASMGQAKLFPRRVEIRFDGATKTYRLTFSGFAEAPR